jgi:hypothetical protein
MGGPLACVVVGMPTSPHRYQNLFEMLHSISELGRSLELYKQRINMNLC